MTVQEMTAQEIVNFLTGKYHLTLAEIAVKMRVSTATIYKWGKGSRHPHYFTVRELRQLLAKYDKKDTSDITGGGRER